MKTISKNFHKITCKAGPGNHHAKYEITRGSVGFPYLKEKHISEILEVNVHFQWNLLLICVVIDCSASVLVCGGGEAGGSENRKEDRGRGGNFGFSFAFSLLPLPKIFIFSTSQVI